MEQTEGREAGETVEDLNATNTTNTTNAINKSDEYYESDKLTTGVFEDFAYN